MVMVTRSRSIAPLLCLPPYNVHAELQRLSTGKQYSPENIKPAVYSQKGSSLQ